MGSCGKCPNTWSGKKQCHCGGLTGCHQTFSTESNFDAHRVGERLPLKCADPTEIGLEQNPRGIWKQPGEVDVYDRMKGNDG